MDIKRRLTNKYILLAILLIAVFVLPGCRTRITNNSEVGNVQYDEDGFMSETYQERRDELGLSTAERPIMPNLGSGEADNNDDFAEGESIDYNPEEFEEDFTEPENNTNSETNNNTNTNTTTRPGNTTPTRRTTPTTRRSPTGTTTTRVTVTFNANGGSIDGKSTKAVSYTKGAKLGTLPKPTHSDSNQEFEGWYTSKTGGSSVKSTDTVSASRTLYAHWKTKEVSPPTPTPEPQPETKYYYVTIDSGNGDEAVKREVKEGEKYTISSDDKPFYKGHAFKGWSGSNGKDYNVGDKVDAEITLTAKWEDWFDIYDDAAKDKSGKKCLILNSDEEKETFITGCNCDVVTSDEEDFDYVIVFDSKPSEAYDAAKANEKYKGKIIALSNKAISTSDDYEYLLYKIVLLEKIYGGIKYQDAQKDMDLKADFRDKD